MMIRTHVAVMYPHLRREIVSGPTCVASIDTRGAIVIADGKRHIIPWSAIAEVIVDEEAVKSKSAVK